MKLPVNPPIEPMLAKLVREMPSEEGYVFEPKWDGFRALVFKDGDEVHIQSRDLKPLERYFPELHEHFLARLPPRVILDGEIVIAGEDGLEFGTLQLRLHPAKSRIDKLAAETPASFVAFDLLAEGDDDLTGCPFLERRERLSAILDDAEPPLYLTPMTTDVEQANDWFRRFEGAGLDGVIAKAADLLYQPKKRVMLKVKHRRTADCVVAGFRWHKRGAGELIGSLLLGLYDPSGRLQHVGITSSFKMDYRRTLVEELAPLRENALDEHPWSAWAAAEPMKQRRPGMMSRWSREKDLSWEPLRIERVVEVAYDGLQGGRFRHAATFVRWREDKRPPDCDFTQLEVVAPYELKEIFRIERGRS